MPISISPGAVKDTEFLSLFRNRNKGAIARQQRPERRRMKKNFCSAIIPSSRNWSPVYWVKFELSDKNPNPIPGGKLGILCKIHHASERNFCRNPCWSNLLRCDNRTSDLLRLPGRNRLSFYFFLLFVFCNLCFFRL